MEVCLIVSPRETHGAPPWMACMKMRDCGAREGILAGVFGEVYCTSYAEWNEGRLRERDDTFGGNERERGVSPRARLLCYRAT